MVSTWFYGMYWHWKLRKELERHELPYSNIIGSVGALLDVKNAKIYCESNNGNKETFELKKAAKEVRKTPIYLFLSLVIPFGVNVLFS